MKLLKHKKRFEKKGSTIVELLIYITLLAIVLLAVYQLFAQTSTMRLSATIENEIYSDADKIFFELENGIKNANLITSPAIGSSGVLLSLDSGQVVYSLDTGKRMQKTQNGEINKISGTKVTVENLNFEVLGPSTIEPTVKITFSLKGKKLDGGDRIEDFQTAVTIR